MTNMTCWSNDLQLTFLEMYQGEPVLWDAKHPGHKDRNEVQEAWGRLSEVLQIPVDDLKRKKDSLMATFRVHRRKRRALEEAGSGAEETYKPIWFAFDLMNSFLGDGSANKTARNTPTGVQERNDIKVEEEYMDGDMDDDLLSEPTRSLQTTTEIRRYRNPSDLVAVRHTLNETQTSPLNNELYHQKGNKREKDEDECELYGEILAKKLKKLSYLERLKLMHDIDGLFIRYLTGNTTIFDGTSSPTTNHIRTDSELQPVLTDRHISSQNINKGEAT